MLFRSVARRVASASLLSQVIAISLAYRRVCGSASSDASSDEGPAQNKSLVDYLRDLKVNAAFTRSQRFPRDARLLRHVDFQRVYKHGRRHFSTNMTVFYLLRQASNSDVRAENVRLGPRIGITVGRVLGIAVKRNRIKRGLREAVRLKRALLEAPVDVVINPKKSTLTVGFPVVLEEVTRAFETISRKLAEK